MLFFLKYEVNEEDAVEKFITNFPSMKELSIANPMFVDALLNICTGILADKQKWAKAKLFVAAALSIGDMITDVMMVAEYSKQGESGYALATLGSVFANLGFQAIVAFIQNRAKPRRR